MLYHYCSSKSFQSIFSRKKLRLSSLLLSNDYNEGNVVSALIDTLLSPENILDKDKKEISNLLNFFRNYFHGIGFCLSEEGDLLSQWRGYADNGYGLSIGFSKSELDNLCKNYRTDGQRDLRLKQINYESSKHFPIVSPVIDSLKKICSDPIHNTTPLTGLLALASSMGIENEDIKRDEKRRSALMLSLLPLSDELYTLKNSAFSEEKEWRLISHIEGDEFHGINFYAKQEKLIPYDEIGIDEQLNTIIREIIVGPKHDTPIDVIRDLLISKGLKNIEVKKSKASYR